MHISTRIPRNEPWWRARDTRCALGGEETESGQGSGERGEGGDLAAELAAGLAKALGHIRQRPDSRRCVPPRRSAGCGGGLLGPPVWPSRVASSSQTPGFDPECAASTRLLIPAQKRERIYFSPPSVILLGELQ